MTENHQTLVDIRQSLTFVPQDLPVATPSVFGRTPNYAGGHRIQMDIEDKLLKLPLALNELGLVAPLPERAIDLLTPIKPLAEAPLDQPHASPQRNAPAAQRQVVVIRHHTPRQHRQSVPAFDIANNFDQVASFGVFQEYTLSPANAAVHVVIGTINE
jgi:hypothetical protein